MRKSCLRIFWQNGPETNEKKNLDSSSSFEHGQIGFVKFWKIILDFAQEKGVINEPLKKKLSCRHCSVQATASMESQGGYWKRIKKKCVLRGNFFWGFTVSKTRKKIFEINILGSI